MIPNREFYRLVLIVEVAEHVSGDSPIITVTPHLTLGDLGVGHGPIGQGEFLEFQHQLEVLFKIKFLPNEIPNEPTSASKLTIGQIGDFIAQKLSQKVT